MNTELSLPSTDAAAWWRLWAIAAIAHGLGEASFYFSFATVVYASVGLIALATLLRPNDWRLHVLLSAGTLASIWVQAPFIGNHWLVAGFISLVGLVAMPWRAGWFERAAPGMRLVLISFYSFAAFAKLNSSFFDRTESCAAYFANRTFSLWQLPEIPLGSPLVLTTAIATATIELSVPLLLVFRRTRRFGVPLAIVFHFLVAFDLRQHFFDFTMTLIPLFLLFTPPGTLTKIDRWWRWLANWLTNRAAVVLTGLLAALIASSAVGLPDTLRGLAILGTWATWLLFGTSLVIVILRTKWQAEPLTWSPGPLSALVLCLVVLNGLTPYLGLKTSTSFNMYSNLVSGGDASNHYIVRETVTLRDGVDDLVTILDSSDTGLANYVDSGLAVPLTNVAHYLSDHQDASVSYERDGVVTVIERAGDHPELVKRQSLLVHKFAFLRAVPTESPAACLALWGVAG